MKSVKRMKKWANTQLLSGKRTYKTIWIKKVACGKYQFRIQVNYKEFSKTLKTRQQAIKTRDDFFKERFKTIYNILIKYKTKGQDIPQQKEFELDSPADSFFQTVENIKQQKEQLPRELKEKTEQRDKLNQEISEINQKICSINEI